jgi:hypothetical protein
VLLAALSGFSSGSAGAQNAETIADIRCVIVGAKSANSDNPQQQKAGATMVIYYIGRLDGRTPALDVERLLVSESSKMTPSDYTVDAKRCAAWLTEKAQQIAKIGKDLLQLGQKAPTDHGK